MQWTWTWANLRRCWGTERPGVLQSMGSQRVGHNCVTEQQQTSWKVLNWNHPAKPLPDSRNTVRWLLWSECLYPLKILMSKVMVLGGGDFRRKWVMRTEPSWKGLAPLESPQQKRHRCIKQSFGLCWRGRGWDDLGEQHWNMYNIICERNRHSRFNAWYRMLGADALGWPRGMVWGRKWEGGLGWGARVHRWLIHVDAWQNQYNIVK